MYNFLSNHDLQGGGGGGGEGFMHKYTQGFCGECVSSNVVPRPKLHHYCT